MKVDPSLGELGVLLEPTSVVAKAWEQVDRIGGRAHWEPKTAVVTGAGPVGLLAALLGVQRGPRGPRDRPDGDRPQARSRAGARAASTTPGTISDACPAPDVILECTGVGPLVFDAIEHVGPGGVVCLTGVSSGGRPLDVDAGTLNRTMVLENEAVVGSVNANRRHYEAGADALAKADRVLARAPDHPAGPARDWAKALERSPDDVKVVIEVGVSE